MPSAIVLSDKKVKLTNCKHPLLMNSKKKKKKRKQPQTNPPPPKKKKKKQPLALHPGEAANNVGHVH